MDSVSTVRVVPFVHTCRPSSAARSFSTRCTPHPGRSSQRRPHTPSAQFGESRRKTAAFEHECRVFGRGGGCRAIEFSVRHLDLLMSKSRMDQQAGLLGLTACKSCGAARCRTQDLDQFPGDLIQALRIVASVLGQQVFVTPAYPSAPGRRVWARRRPRRTPRDFAELRGSLRRPVRPTRPARVAAGTLAGVQLGAIS